MSNLVSYFPQYLTTNSLFQKMSGFGAPWSTSIGKSMDIAYFTMYSGIKNPTQFVKVNSMNNIANSVLISQVLWDMYGENWKKLWNGFNSEYNPINNYNVDETIERDQTSDRNISRSDSTTGTVDETQKQTNSETGTENVVTDDAGSNTLNHGHLITRDGTVDTYNYGFNSEEKVPVSNQTEHATDQNTGTDVTTTTAHGTKDTTASTSGEADIATNSASESKSVGTTSDMDSLNENITRTRKGNIGQNTYQELLTQEFELWKWNFYTQVFEDVDKFLVLSVYDCCDGNHGIL